MFCIFAFPFWLFKYVLITCPFCQSSKSEALLYRQIGCPCQPMSGMEYVRTNSLQLAQQCLVWKPDGVREEFVICPWLMKRCLSTFERIFVAPTLGSEAIWFSVWVRLCQKAETRRPVFNSWSSVLRIAQGRWCQLTHACTMSSLDISWISMFIKEKTYKHRNLCLVLGLGCAEASTILNLNAFLCLFHVSFRAGELTFQSVPAPSFRIDPLVNLWETMSASMMPHNAPSVWRTTVALKIGPRLGVVAYHKRNYEEVWSLSFSRSQW